MGILSAFPGGGGNKVLKTEIITETRDWVSPVDSAFVRLFGGGGASAGETSYSGGGGGGHMAVKQLSLTKGATYRITIGSGGAGGAGNGGSGGTTSFSNLLSAPGGTGGLKTGNGGSGGSGGTNCIRFLFAERGWM